MDYLRDYAARLGGWLVENPSGKDQILTAGVNTKTLEDVLNAQCHYTALMTNVGRIESVTGIKIGDFMLRSAKMSLWKGLDKAPHIISLERLLEALVDQEKKCGRHALARFSGLDTEQIRRYTGLKGRPNRMIPLDRLEVMLKCVAVDAEIPHEDTPVKAPSTRKQARVVKHVISEPIDEMREQAPLVVKTVVIEQRAPDPLVAEATPVKTRTKRVRAKPGKKVSEALSPAKEPLAVLASLTEKEPERSPSQEVDQDFLRLVTSNTLSQIEVAGQVLQDVVKHRPFTDGDRVRLRKVMLRCCRAAGMDVEVDFLKLRQAEGTPLSVAEFGRMTGGT